MNDTSRVHVSYIISILIFIIISLVTVNWSNIPKLVEYITFSLTLTSLVLAILAIIYSFLSNSSLSQTLGSLTNLSKIASQSSKELSYATEKLLDEVSIIPTRIQDVEGKLDQTHVMLKEMGEQSTKNVEATPVDKIKDVDFNAYLASSSFSGLMFTHICYIAEKQGKGFKLNELSEKISAFTLNYIQGYSIALKSCGLLTYKMSNDIISSVDINDLIGEKSLSEMKSRIKDHKDKKTKEFFQENLEQVLSYFE